MTLPNSHQGTATTLGPASSGRLASIGNRVLKSTTALHVAILAVLAYLPTLTAAPGKMPTDTKLFLYLDPARLTGDALYSWDSRQFAGWVPHQTVSYLWPAGPWFSIMQSLGVPDWVAHRLWIGTLMFVAGLGVRWVAKMLGMSAGGALVAALFYQLTPYILPYISRTSTMLLPWAGLGWLIGLTIRAATRTRWRDIGLFGLVIATISATNATAILMIAPAPVLWLVHAAWQRSITWRRALVVAAKLGSISLVVSAWWISMLSVQGKYGADVLGYSETLEAVSLTSSSTEVMRGLGYWLFYVRDPVGFTTTASFDYMASGRAIAVTFLILGLAMVGLVATRWSARRFAILLVFVGVVLAVGVHPIDDPSPLMSGLADNSRSSLALAMRSSTRALPLSTLGFALGLGALATAVSHTRIRLRQAVPFALAALAVVNLPVLFNSGFVDPILIRDEHPPESWEQAADKLDSLPDGYRVMQLPGIEFGAYRWGYTVDPPLPGMTNRPLVTRDLLPLGSAGAMDLLYALDDRFQEGSQEIEAVAPISRLFGVDTIWLPNDVAFDRFRTPRPEITSALFARAATDELAGAAVGLGPSIPFGDPAPNVPTISMVDEDSISRAEVGQPLPAVELVPVSDPIPIVRVKTGQIVVAGSGDGLVDAAAAGVLTGNELIRYSADLIADPTSGSISDADRVIITDSNRDRAHHWRGSQDVWGFTEDGSNGPGVLVPDTSDQRIPVFPSSTADDQTIAVQRGGTTAAASSYGEPYAYRPENRAAMAVDGLLTTSWVVADRADAIGEFLRLSTESYISSVRLTQPRDDRNRWITSVDITDASGRYAVALDEESRSSAGQQVTLRAPSREVTITITGTQADPSTPPNSLDAVGFAEAATALGPSDEVTRVPSNVLSEVTDSQDVDIVLTRLRTRATNRWRSDPEATLVRAFTLGSERTFTPTVTTRLDLRASDTTIATLLGWEGTTADRRLTGVPAMGGWAATDGDPTTKWVTPFGEAVGSTLTIPLSAGEPLDPAGTDIVLQQPTSGTFNTITEVTLSDGEGVLQTLAVPAADANGSSTIRVAGLNGTTLRLTITMTSENTTTDRRYAEQVLLPTALAEVTLDGVIPAALPATLATECRSDLVEIDGVPISIKLTGNVPDLFDGEPATVENCDRAGISLSAGEHIVRSAAGTNTGVDVDRLLLNSPAAGEPGAPSSDSAGPTATVTDNGRIHRSVTVGPCPAGCWFIFGEGLNQGWSASIDGDSMGTQQRVDGGFNGWYLPPSTESRQIELRWEGQTRLTIGLILSGFGVLVCIALIALDRRRSHLALPESSEFASPEFASPEFDSPEFVGLRLPRPSRHPFDPFGPAVVTTGAATILGFLVISPTWGLLCGLIAAVSGFVFRRPQLVGPIAVVIVAVLAVVMIRRYLILKPFVNAGWPSYFEDLHRPGLAAMVLLAASVIPRRRRTDEQ